MRFVIHQEEGRPAFPANWETPNTGEHEYIQAMESPENDTTLKKEDKRDQEGRKDKENDGDTERKKYSREFEGWKKWLSQQRETGLTGRN